VLPRHRHRRRPGAGRRCVRAFAGSGVQVSHLSLFPMPTVPDLRAHLLAQDVVWVGGGSVANLLAVWRVHGLDEVFRRCGRPASCWAGCRPARCAGTSAAPPTPTAPTCAR
jgi:peptidase E